MINAGRNRTVRTGVIVNGGFNGCLGSELVPVARPGYSLSSARQLKESLKLLALSSVGHTDDRRLGVSRGDRCRKGLYGNRAGRRAGRASVKEAQEVLDVRVIVGGIAAGIRRLCRKVVNQADGRRRKSVAGGRSPNSLVTYPA
jgi:hypothetical protein